ncbi:MAG: chitobiase/beta-hexosaminidase, partial [Deltaproteobacteria bacterium]
IYEAGVTDSAGASPLVGAQLGYGPLTANPEYEAGWRWFSASYNAGFVDPSNDEYQATFVAPAAGSYGYAFRFTLDGQNWTVCDLNGAGQNGGLTFDLNQIAPLTVAP